MKLIEILKKSLIGKKLTHRNKHSREVTLEIEDFKIITNTVDLEPATAKNDWWPASSTTIKYTIYFVDGSSIETYMEEDLKLS